jgi:antitoxin MazE7
MLSCILGSMPMTTMKVDSEIRDRLAKVARARGVTIGSLLLTAAEQLEDDLDWDEIDAAYERLQREDPSGWQEYLNELAEWENADLDDLTKNAADEWPEFNR